MPEIKNNAPQVRFAEFRAVNEDERYADFVISTEAVDTYGTVFRLDGWDFSRYDQNPIVPWVHRSNDSNPDMIIGTGKVFREGNQIIGRCFFEPADENPLAEKIFRKVKRGTIRMASVGADPHEGNWGDASKGEQREVFYFTRQSLLEWSIVGLGSNPDALKRSADGLEAIRAEIPKETAPEGDDIEIQRSFRERELQMLDLKV